LVEIAELLVKAFSFLREFDKQMLRLKTSSLDTTVLSRLSLLKWPHGATNDD
jgi:hypothetical protein